MYMYVDRLVMLRDILNIMVLKWFFLTKGWGILTAKIPLVYMLKAQQFSVSTHTLDKVISSLTHVGTPQLKMGHLAEKLTKGWGILTAKIPLVYMLKAQQFSMSTYTLDKVISSLSHT